MRRHRRLAVLAVVALAIAVAVVVWSARQLGPWLVAVDPLERAPVIAVMAGDAPFRAVEAAQLRTEGWAGQIWLTRASVPGREAALARLGIHWVSDDAYNLEALERLGVPV